MEVNEEAIKIAQMEETDHQEVLRYTAQKLRECIALSNECLQFLNENKYNVFFSVEGEDEKCGIGIISNLRVDRIFKEIKEEL